MKPIEIVDGIFWVGSIDWNIRDFHGYSTYEGSTYNAFLVMDEKITLVDTVKKGFEDEMLERVSRIVDPAKIDYVISNHTEMDHSGGLPKVMHRIGEEKPVFCSQVGFKNLKAHFRGNLNLKAVENGSSLSLGKRTLNFLETRMLHWPDSMFSYCPEEKLLFSSDAFGQHYASVERFDDEVGDAIMPHAHKYYANILNPYSQLILKLVDKVTEMGLELDVVCPDHGLIWRKNFPRIVEAYVRWAKQEPTRKAVVIFDTMWHSTERMAGIIVDALGEYNVDAKMRHLRSWDRSDIITEIHDAGAVLVGSPTLNNGLFPTVADFLCYLKGLRPMNKVAGVFGSYGWSGEAVKMLKAEMEAMKCRVIEPSPRSLFVPDEKVEESCRELARQVAEALPPA